MTSRLLTRLARDFPQSPDTCRLKAALLFAGVRYHPALSVATDWAFPNYTPHVLAPDAEPFRGRRTAPLPYMMVLQDGTHVRLRIKPDSPFAIEPTDDARRFVLRDQERGLTPLSFEPRYPWMDKLTADGTPMRATGLSQHGDMLVLNVAPGCEYFVVPGQDRRENLRCTFCLYGVPDKPRMEPLGQKLYATDVPESTLARVVEACQHSQTHARQIYLVGGSMLTMKQEGERYVTIARRLAEAGLTERYYVVCGSGAIPRDAMQALKRLGVRGACFNMEVWDPAQFERVCPGKARFVGRDGLLAALDEAVDVFGRGNVATAFVGGAELDGEGALASPEAALQSAIESGAYLIPRGIQPLYSIYWRVSGKDRGEETSERVAS